LGWSTEYGAQATVLLYVADGEFLIIDAWRGQFGSRQKREQGLFATEAQGTQRYTKEEQATKSKFRFPLCPLCLCGEKVLDSSPL
jgi:hypothetical protein